MRHKPWTSWGFCKLTNTLATVIFHMNSISIFHFVLLLSELYLFYLFSINDSERQIIDIRKQGFMREEEVDMFLTHWNWNYLHCCVSVLIVLLNLWSRAHSSCDVLLPPFSTNLGLRWQKNNNLPLGIYYGYFHPQHIISHFKCSIYSTGFHWQSQYSWRTKCIWTVHVLHPHWWAGECMCGNDNLALWCPDHM